MLHFCTILSLYKDTRVINTMLPFPSVGIAAISVSIHPPVTVTLPFANPEEAEALLEASKKFAMKRFERLKKMGEE